MGSTEIPLTPPQPVKRIANGILGILFLLSAEVMYFAGLISAYIIGRSNEPEWPPYGQPRLPIEVTAVNTLVLLASGVTAWLFVKNLSRKNGLQNLTLLGLTLFLGVVFLTVQGTEWVRLVEYGLTSRSSLYGAFFYVVIGSHAVHAFAGLIAMVYLYFFLRKNGASQPEEALVKTRVCTIYWYFVVSIWPLLYYLVYLV